VHLLPPVRAQTHAGAMRGAPGAETIPAGQNGDTACTGNTQAPAG